MKKDYKVEANPKKVKVEKVELIRLKLPNSKIIGIDDNLKRIYRIAH